MRPIQRFAADVLTSAIAIAVALLVGGAVSIGDPPKAGGAASPVIDQLDFGGGPAPKYIEEIRKRLRDVNIVVMDDLDRYMIGAVSLRGVSVSSALRLIDDQTFERDGRLIRISVEPIVDSDEPGGHPIYRVRTEDRGDAGEAGSGPVRSSVWSVQDVIDAGMTAKQILTAVETALQLVGGGDPAKVKFHEETALLLASGKPDQLQSIDEVLNRLRETARTRLKERRGPIEAALSETRAALDSALAQAKNAQAALQSRAAELEMMQVRVEALSRERERMEQQLVQLRDEHQRAVLDAQVQIQALQMELDRIRKGGSAADKP